MRVIPWEDLIAGRDEPSGPTSCAVGAFDGVHVGHRELLRRAAALSPLMCPCAVTFQGNPKAALRPEAYPGDILSLDGRLEALAGAGAELVVLIDFSGNFGKLGGKEFIGLLRDRGKLRHLAVGSDFRCGHGLDTDAETIAGMLARDGISTDIVAPVTAGGLPVSSSRIRAAIAAGNLVEATALLGRNFELDLRGAPSTPGPAGIAFDARALGRLTPPPGRYPVVLRKEGYPSGTEPAAEFVDVVDQYVDIVDGRVVLPSGVVAERVEFLPSVARSV